MSFLDQYEAADKAFRMGKVLSDDNETLLSHLSGLSNLTNINTGTQHRDIIRGITINHILLQRHVDSLNKQNSKTQRWFMAFAVISAIGAVAPYLMPPATTPVQAVIAQPSHIQQPLPPIREQPQVAHPAKERKP